jgi:hypothetical protein
MRFRHTQTVSEKGWLFGVCHMLMSFRDFLARHGILGNTPPPQAWAAPKIVTQIDGSLMSVAISSKV